MIQKIDPNRPLYFSGVPRVLLSEILAQTRIVAFMFVATLVPARRATRVDPMFALRAE